MPDPEAHESHDGRNVHYGAPARLAHLGNGPLRAQENSLGIDVEEPVPVLGAVLVGSRGAGDSGIVNENVHAAKPFDGGLDGPLPIVVTGDVHVDEECLTAGLVDSGLDLGALFVEDVADDYLGAFTGEELGVDGAHPMGCAGDDGHFSFQPTHDAISSSLNYVTVEDLGSSLHEAGSPTRTPARSFEGRMSRRGCFAVCG